MALRTSLVIAGDASGAVAATRDAEQAIVKAAVAYDEAYEATTRLAKAQTTATQEMSAAKAAYKAGETGLFEYKRSILESKSALSLIEAEHRKTMAELRTAGPIVGTSTRQAAAGYQNFGRQMQDVAIQLQSGTNIGTIIAQQGGQMSDAIAQMGGKASGFASFMAGPWGALITVGIGVLINLAMALGKTGDETDKLKGQTLDLSDATNRHKAAVGELRKAIDDYNEGQEKARQSTRLATQEALAAARADFSRALALREVLAARMADQQDQAAQFEKANGPTVGADLGAQMTSKAMVENAALIKSLQGEINNRALEMGSYAAKAVDPLEAIRQKYADINREVEKGSRLGLYRGVAVADVMRELARNQQSELNTAQRAGRTGSSGQSGREINMSVARSIAERAGWQVNSGTRPTWIRDEVRGGGSSQERLYNQWIAQGRPASNPTARPGTSAHERSNALDIQFAPGLTLDAIVKAYADEGVRLTKKLKEAGHFHIEWSTSGADKVEREAKRLADQSRKDAEDFDRLMARGASLAEAVLINMTGIDTYLQHNVDVAGDFTAAMAGLTAESDKTALAFRAVQDETAATLGNLIDMINAVDRLGGMGKVLGNVGSLAVGMTNGDYRGVNGPVGSMLALSPELRGLGVEIGQQLDKVFGGTGSFAKTMTRVMEGAGLGVAGATMVFGQKGNNLGSSIGGVLGQSLGQSLSPAIGKAVSGGLGKALGAAAGPLGAIAGGILGSLVGGLFASKPHGTATITSTTDKAQVSGSTSEIASGLNQMSTGVQGALKQIADRLGADVGSFAVSIGQYKDYYQVSSVANDPYLGKSNYNKKSSNALYDGKDASAAVAAAIQNAIADGGVKGLSAAVEKALKSSPDIDVALAEALKVQSVELAIGGLGAQLEKQFRDFERQAADRLRIAKQYGFDVVKMEERNAADRLALSKKLAADQIGSLQSLIDSMTSGSLFEGSAIDQRQAVLDQIAATKADAAAGVEGAADKLSGLLEQLNNVSRDAYGTTGGFAADRATILDEARATIAAANQRVSDAAKASDPALTQTNAALNENNDQNAAMLAALGDNNALLAALVAQGGVTDWAGLAALASTGKAFGY